jgi:hypothetical protein
VALGIPRRRCRRSLGGRDLGDQEQRSERSHLEDSDFTVSLQVLALPVFYSTAQYLTIGS